MIKVIFHSENDALTGFEISGHSGSGTAGNDIICAAVSSAAYLTANTLIEIKGIKAEASVSDGEMKISISEKDAEKAKDSLLGLELHLRELAEQYPNNVTVTTEV